MPRMVKCVKLGRELPGLDKPPFPGQLGQRIYENISKQAYDMWPAQSTLIINHYGLNMAIPKRARYCASRWRNFSLAPRRRCQKVGCRKTENMGTDGGNGQSRKGGGGASRKK